MIDIIIRIVIAFVLISLKIYWLRAEQEAYEAIPPTTTRRYKFIRFLKLSEFLFYVVITIQLMGLDIVPFKSNVYSYVGGMLLFLFGVYMSIAGRVALGDNWTHALDYQIKSKQELVKNDIYKQVRHPIYSGAIFAKVGVEILLHSWLWLPLFVIESYFFYQQAKKEEAILARHFGKVYLTYLRHTKMFVPYLF